MSVYGGDGIPIADGRGLFAAALTAALPAPTVEEEGRLRDPMLRDNFTTQKFAVLAHSPGHDTRLGRLVAGGGPWRSTAAC